MIVGFHTRGRKDKCSVFLIKTLPFIAYHDQANTVMNGSMFESLRSGTNKTKHFRLRNSRESLEKLTELHNTFQV